MKYIISLILTGGICGLALCGSVAEYKENLKQCAQLHNAISFDNYTKALSGEDTAVTPEMKCFFLCVAEKMKFFKDGALLTQNLAENLLVVGQEDKIAKLASECNIKGTDNCDTAYRVITCLAKNAPVISSKGE